MAKIVAVYWGLRIKICGAVSAALYIFMLALAVPASADELKLRDLINDALRQSPDILASEARVKAASFRIPQAGSLPDPMFMFGYQNAGWRQYTFTKDPDAQWMFSVSQMFPFPGKTGLKEEMTKQDAEAASIMHEALRLKTAERIQELYFDLLLAYKNIDLIQRKTELLMKIEDAAQARYSAGMGMQSDLLMAQTEKYMLMEKGEMQKQKVRSLEAMLSAAAGRDPASALGRPADGPSEPYAETLESLLEKAYRHSPEVRLRQRMAAAAEIRVKMAEKDFYPDFTVTGGYATRGGGQFMDMWSLQTTINLPVFSSTKQKQALKEAEALLDDAKRGVDAAKLMVASSLRDAYSMQKATERLIGIYKDGLIPRAYQDYEAALSAYVNGKSDAQTVISRLKAVIDSEASYWVQYAEREKSIARFGTMTGDSTISGGRQ